MNFQMFKLDLEKAEKLEIKLATSVGSSNKKEFQRIARRDKKAFLSDQCKETEENNRIGKYGPQETVENSERDGITIPPDLPLAKPICRSGSNS